MIKNLRNRINVLLGVFLLAAIIASPITFPKPMGCESSAGSVCTI